MSDCAAPAPPAAPQSIGDWKKSVIGKIEPGITCVHENADESDEPNQNSFFWYGTVWIADIDDMRAFYKKFSPQIIDIVDEKIACLHITLPNLILINAPSIVKPCFQFSKENDRAGVFHILNLLYAVLNENAKVYIVLNLYPLKLAYFMRNSEMIQLCDLMKEM